MNKVMVFGMPGAGKTTFVRILARKTGLPLYHLDKYFFIKGWVERPEAEFLELQKKMIAKKKWIIDGNSMHSLQLRFAVADTVIYFSQNRFLCLWRILKRYGERRYLKKSSGADDRGEGCPEKIRWKLIQYLWEYEGRWGPVIDKLKKAYPKAKFYRFNNDQDVALFLKNLK